MEFGYGNKKFRLEDGVKYFCDFKTDFENADFSSLNNEWYALHFPIPANEGYLEPDVDGWALTEKNIYSKDGKLYLIASDAEYEEYPGREAKYNGKYYMGSEVRSKDYYTYGYFEARMKINTSVGICPAFWLLGKPDDTLQESTFYEFDIFEAFGVLDGTIKATPLKHVVKYEKVLLPIISGYGNYVKSESGKYVQLYKQNGDFVYNDEGYALAKDQQYYDLKNTTTYNRKQSVYNGYNEDHFGKMYEVLVDSEQLSYYKGFDDGEFHTFAFEWTEESITWIYDGVAVIRFNFQDAYGQYFEFRPTGEMQLVFTCYSGNDVSGKTGVPTPCDCEGGVCTKGDSIHTDWEDGSSLEIDYILVRDI